MTDDYVDALNNIRQVLSEQADILIYGCNFAEGQTGQEAAALLSQLTGADVAASTDTTGYAGLGGNWALETRTGLIETHLAVNNEVQADWVGLLAVNDAPTFDVGTGIVTTAVGPDSVGRGVTVQADGKIVVTGFSNNGGNFTVALTRYNSNGTLDTSFGTGGIVTTVLGSDSLSESVTLQADGKIVVAGRGGSSGSRTFALTRYDSNGSFDMTFNPVVNTLGGTVSFTENGTPIVLDNNAAILDDELSTLNNFAGATLALARNAGANSEDVYSASGTLSFAGGNVTVGGTTIGTVTTNSGGTLALTFNASATNALVNSALQQIAYSNVSDAPPASVQINWTFNDGNSGAQGSGAALSTTGSTTITITAVNDAPANTVPGVQSVAEDTPLALSGISANDVDGNLSSFCVVSGRGGHFRVCEYLTEIVPEIFTGVALVQKVHLFPFVSEQEKQKQAWRQRLVG